MKTPKKHNLLFVILIFLLAASKVYPQTDTASHSMDKYNSAAGAVVFLLVAFMFVLIFILSASKYENYESKGPRMSLLAKISQVLNRGVPIEQEKDIMLEHDFDEIYELDNKVPPWFNILFYGTILFALVYIIDYHVLGSGSVMLDEYTQEITVANQKREELIRTGAFINENNVTLFTEAAELDKGKQIFTTNCSPCHGPDAGGTVGPNLTDEYWIHGGGIKNVFKTVKNGVPVKGMIAWQTMLNPKQMQQVSSYVLSLQGTKPSVVKPPEGNIWIETDSTKTVKDTLKISNNDKNK